MGLFDDKDDKTESATPKKLNEARNKGQVAKSQELGMAMLLLTALIALEIWGGGLQQALEAALRDGFSLRIPETMDKDWAVATIRKLIFGVFPAVLPLLALLVVVSIVTGFAQVGVRFVTEPIMPKIEKLNPMKGLARIFSLRALVTTGVAFLKFAVLGTILWLNVRSDLPVLMLLADHPFSETAPVVARLAFKILWWISIVLLAISLLDMLYQKWQFQRDMRMSKKDIKDEQKNTDGDPEVKGRIRRAMREVSMRRMMEEVPKADVIITNPTHFAVALKYDRINSTAPTVVAKGVDEVALKIREIATDNDVPIMEDPPLARAIFRGVRLGEEIPRRFYEAVATVLAHVFRLKKEAV